MKEIYATLENDTLTFIDENPQFRPEDIERALAEAQRQCLNLVRIDRDIGKSKEFLQKASVSPNRSAYVNLLHRL